ncbi:MAG TPA: flagellar basal body L-ring protein FlgH [Verrucomicrobiae bacterium]|nr:flagellar basal body L-ring protein FlgH [Verrucomicrobiae bacterium]
MKLNPTILSAAIAVFTLSQLPANAQSLWHSDSSRAMFSDKRGCGVGDIITVLVQENSTATKKNTTQTSKAAAMDASVSTFLYGAGAGTSALLSRGGQMPALKYNSNNTFDGGGSIDDSQNLVTSVAVKITDVLPNGNFIIEGHRQTAFSGEKQNATLHGIVRPDDILANNTVFSYNIADATVDIVSKGTITDAQNKGWFTRIWEKVTPF